VTPALPAGVDPGRGGDVLALLLSACVVGGGERSWLFEDATALSVALGSGEVTVVSSPDAAAVVAWDGGGVGQAANPDVWQDGGCVFVDAKGGLGGGELEVEVPAGASVTAHLSRGEITITLDAPADIDACVGAGEITIEVPPGAYALDLQMGAGEISSDITHDAGAEHVIRACAGAGEVTVR
jgi:hypothetical protein